ncbi:MAG: hypothetical protein EOP18_02365 [Rhizobiaceae bacterium]|nr:MAG: hypothetical protein EOP18_02365 [Rhizobiaceae bacterium]
MFAHRFLASGVLLGMSLPFTSFPALAGSDDAALSRPGEFHLLRADGARLVAQRFRLDGSAATDRFRLPKSRPQWTYSPIEGGPTVVLAALGGGRKGAPKLAHVRIDWHF